MRTTKRRLHHKELGAVLSLTGDMAVVCAFFVSIRLVLTFS